LIIDNKGTDELTNRSVRLSSDNRDTDELTNISVHLSSDNRDTDELTNRSVYLILSSESRLVGNELINRSVHFRVEKDELTHISLILVAPRDDFTNRSDQPLRRDRI
jgi:hypothetical protein